MANNKSINEFLKELTSKTGLYGEELFKHIYSMLDGTEALTQEKKENKAIAPTKGFTEFYGRPIDALHYLEELGAEEKTIKLFKASSPEFQTAILCAETRSELFHWTVPVIQVSPKTGAKRAVERTFVAFWNEEQGIYDMGDGGRR